jgi:hypothetical protein
VKFELGFRSGGKAVVEASFMKVEGDERPSYTFYAKVEGYSGTHAIAAFPTELVAYVVPSEQAQGITEPPKGKAWGPA